MPPRKTKDEGLHRQRRAKSDSQLPPPSHSITPFHHWFEGDSAIAPPLGTLMSFADRHWEMLPLQSIMPLDMDIVKTFYKLVCAYPQLSLYTNLYSAIAPLVDQSKLPHCMRMDMQMTHKNQQPVSNNQNSLPPITHPFVGQHLYNYDPKTDKYYYTHNLNFPPGTIYSPVIDVGNYRPEPLGMRPAWNYNKGGAGKPGGPSNFGPGNNGRGGGGRGGAGGAGGAGGSGGGFSGGGGNPRSPSVASSTSSASTVRPGSASGRRAPGTSSRMNSSASPKMVSFAADNNATTEQLSNPRVFDRRFAFSGPSTGPGNGSGHGVASPTPNMHEGYKVSPKLAQIHAEQDVAGFANLMPIEIASPPNFKAKLASPEGQQATMVTPVHAHPNQFATSPESFNRGNQTEGSQPRVARSSSFKFPRVVDPATGETSFELPPAFVPRSFQATTPPTAPAPASNTVNEGAGAGAPKELVDDIQSFGYYVPVTGKEFSPDLNRDLMLQRAFGCDGPASFFTPNPHFNTPTPARANTTTTATTPTVSNETITTQIDSNTKAIMDMLDQRSTENGKITATLIDNETLNLILKSINRIESKVDLAGRSINSVHERVDALQHGFQSLHNGVGTMNENMSIVLSNQIALNERYISIENAMKTLLKRSKDHGQSFINVQNSAEMLCENQTKLGESFAVMYEDNSMKNGFLTRKMDVVVRNHYDVQRSLELAELQLYNSSNNLRAMANDVKKLLREQQEGETHHVSGGQLRMQLQAVANDLNVDHSTGQRFPTNLFGQDHEGEVTSSMADQQEDDAAMYDLEEAFKNGTIGNEFAEYYDNSNEATPRHRREMRSLAADMGMEGGEQESRASSSVASKVYTAPKVDQENVPDEAEDGDKTITPGNSRAPTPASTPIVSVIAKPLVGTTATTPRSRSSSPSKVQNGVSVATPTSGLPLQPAPGSAKNSLRIKNKGGSVRGRINNLQRI